MLYISKIRDIEDSKEERNFLSVIERLKGVLGGKERTSKGERNLGKR